MGGTGEYHSFRGETAGPGKGRNGCCGNTTAYQRQRHRLVQPAQIGTFGLSGHIQDRAGRHPEQSFVDNVCKSVSRSSID